MNKLKPGDENFEWLKIEFDEFESKSIYSKINESLQAGDEIGKIRALQVLQNIRREKHNLIDYLGTLLLDILYRTYCIQEQFCIHLMNLHLDQIRSKNI